MEGEGIMRKMTYDREADAIYFHLTNKKVAYSRELDTDRIIDYSEDDEPRGVELLHVSNGVNTDDLPNQAEIEESLYNKGIKTYA